MQTTFIEEDTELAQLIVEEYKGGMSVLEISIKHKLYRRAVHFILKDTIIGEADKLVPYPGKKNYGESGRHNKVITPEIERDIEDAYAETGNITKAAEAGGVTWMTARKVLFIKGRIPFRSRRRGWGCKDIPGDVKAAMVREYRKGKGMKKVAEMFDSSYPSVRDVLREAGIPPQTRNTSTLTPKIAADIVRDYHRGAGFDQLRRTYARSYVTIRRVLADAGVEIRKCGTRTNMSATAAPKVAA